VKSYEQTDIRDFPGEIPYDIIVCDASFISLSQILDAILIHARESTEIILLFKPQFEVGKENLRKTGVPKDETCVSRAMETFEERIKERNCTILAKEKSCLIGEAGNQEWVYWIRKK
jgi:23S rRNA (cytidine1920-2'-O)/16S rRNA (cytidine1409-2'-O)-methyltransferase